MYQLFVLFKKAEAVECRLWKPNRCLESKLVRGFDANSCFKTKRKLYWQNLFKQILEIASLVNLRVKWCHDSCFHNILHTLRWTGSKWAVMPPRRGQSNWWPIDKTGSPGNRTPRDGQWSLDSRGWVRNTGLVILLCSRSRSSGLYENH